MALAVHAGHHHDVLLADAIVQAVRKSGQEDAASTSMDEGVSLRMILDGRNGEVESAIASSTSTSASGVKRTGFTAA